MEFDHFLSIININFFELFYRDTIISLLYTNKYIKIYKL